jgi:hypothetical protein
MWLVLISGNKVSVQAFNDEDPRGRRTLGILSSFTHLLNYTESFDVMYLASMGYLSNLAP